MIGAILKLLLAGIVFMYASVVMVCNYGVSFDTICICVAILLAGWIANSGE